MGTSDQTGRVTRRRASDGLSAGASPPMEGLPPGYHWRPLAADDIATVWELEAAGEAQDDGVVEVDLSDIEADWRQPDFHPSSMSVGVFKDHRLVAYALVFQGRAEALVDPKHRGRGIGSALMRWTWEVARREGRVRVGQTISENEKSAEALFRANGYEFGHTSWILSIDLTALPPQAVLPSGYRLRSYSPGKDDREVFELIDEAFEEWRGVSSESKGFENWSASTLHKVPPGLVVLIEYGANIVGAAIGYDYGPEAEGWIGEIAVKKAHRGRGLGRALLEESFRRFYTRGRRQCGVSTDSRTGALGLYEHAGMSIRRTYTRWTKNGL